MKWDGDSDEVSADMFRPSSWRVGGGNAGGGAAFGAVVVLKVGVESRLGGAGDIGGPSFWVVGLGVGGGTSRL